MSECVIKVSGGADRVDELVSSMRSLAATPPSTMSSGLARRGAVAKSAEADHEYHVGLRVMALLEVPETVRTHLGVHQFIRAVRAALIDATSLQVEVDGMLRPGGRGATGETGGPAGLHFGTLASQQAAMFRGLPRQIAASCVDAFGAATLSPSSAAEAFAVRLLLESSAQPVSLLRLFLQRRKELISSLLDSAGAGSGGSLDEGASIGARLATAAMAFEGTVVLGSSLCHPAPGGRLLIETALIQALEDAPEHDAAEERAAIEGRPADGLGIGSLRRRASTLTSTLRSGGTSAAALATELSQLGTVLAREWAPPGDSPSTTTLAARFGRLIAPTPGGAPRSCAALGDVISLCGEKVLGHRRVLSGGSPESWAEVWATSCGHFCPGRAPPHDALSVVNATIEAACAEVVRERICDLQLELVPSIEEEGDALDPVATPVSAGTGGAATGSSETKRREEVVEMRRQSRLRVQRFDEELGDILADTARIARDGVAPPAVTAALLTALGERLSVICDAVPLPEENRTSGTAKSRAPWPLRRAAARAAIGLDVLLAAATDSRDSDESEPINLSGALQSAASSGNLQLAAKSQEIVDSLRRRSDEAYSAWARLAVMPEGGSATLEAFWRMADDEVPMAFGWGSAKFTRKGPAAAGDKADGSDEMRAVPIPVQASPFVFERLALGAQQALEVRAGGCSGPMPRALVVGLKAALSETFVAAYEAAAPDLNKLKKSGMCHLLQMLFDLRFLRIALSTSPAPGAARPAASQASGASYEVLSGLLDSAEKVALNDPVDRLLYQEVLKSSVNSHVEGVKILLAPFFLHNPLYGFLFPAAGGALGEAATAESDSFELQAAFAPPLRPMLPRFPLLPVATASTLAHSGTAELDARLGLSADAAERAAARAAASANAGGGNTVNAMMRQVGSGLDGLGLGKALGGWLSGTPQQPGRVPQPV
eukprot:gnl/TRDRNA2_/TRDRNA2_83808_c0_seq1.p1 gnl/TRDRNA2_/TRDRNA2_83808_c0~~gnl/TRDRNA2_/TRDRNA2_83808_c0_seq1.p1  ORF type:complete len:969 (+),score=197.33 gnl/TRDRNA2_/TRDRNA2_83808_c0_seq1:71-2908(+)